MGAFGEKLRNQREQRGLTLDAISNATKIGVRMLRALEDEHFDQLPGGVFNKGFVRAYARQVGLDEEETVAGYLATLRENQIQAQTILPDSGSQTTESALRYAGGDTGLDFEDRRKQDRRNLQRRSSGLRIQVPAGNQPPEKRPENHRSKEQGSEELRDDRGKPKENSRYADPFRPDDSAPAPAKSFPHTPPKIGAAVLLLAAALAAWTFYSRGHTAAPRRSATTPNQFEPSVAVPSHASASPASPGLGETSPAATSKPLPTPPAPDPSPAAKTSSLSVPKPPATFTVLVRAEKTTWVSILADGKPVAQETLIAPAHTSVRANREVVVKTGNAAGISFLLDGKPIRSEGNEGEVKTYVFNSSGLTTAPEARAPFPNP